MRKYRVRLTLAICLVVLMMICFSLPSYAADGGLEFAEWYSTSDRICYFPGSTPRYYKVQSNNLFASSDLNSIANFAASQWSSLLSLQPAIENGSEGNEDGEASGGSYDILITDVRRTHLADNVPAGAIGYTSVVNLVERTTTYPHGYCYVFRQFSASVYLIYDSETANYPFNKLRCAVTHELGHAIGYDGHDDRMTSLMYFSDANYDRYGIYTPQARDIAHLRNVYR